MSTQEQRAIRLHARLSIIASSTKETLEKPRVIDLVVTLGEQYQGASEKEYADYFEASLLRAYSEQFISRLQNDAKLRHRLGKTRWEVRLHEYTYRKAELMELSKEI